MHARSERNIASVQLKIVDSPSVSVRKLAAQVNISRESFRRILRKNLKLTPYKMQTSQTLIHVDNVKGCTFINELIRQQQWTLNVPGG